MSNKVKGSVCMSKRLKSAFVVCGLSMCVMFSSVSIMAQETNAATTEKEVQKGNEVMQSEESEAAITVTPTNWNIIDSSYLLKLQGKVLDLSSLPESVNRTILIPKEITHLTIKGSTSKVFEGLVITTENTRTNGLSLYINDLHIKNGNIDTARTSGGDYLYFTGTNKIVANDEKAAVIIPVNKTLTIDSTSAANFLEVVGGAGGGAGIGGSYLADGGAGHIIIKGGTIKSTGKGGGAGIGQGKQPNGSPNTEITIEGGIINADGGSAEASEGGAGIGGSSGGNINNISISGTGTKISAKAGKGAAGIGTGSKEGGNIEIKDGAIIEQAIGNEGGAGIGGSSTGSINDISISGTGTRIFAKAGKGAAGIGTGSKAGGNIEIKDGAIIEEAIGSDGGAGIGSGKGSDATVGDITISSAIIKEATGSSGGAGIGGSDGASPRNIYIKGNTIIGENDASGNPIKGAVGNGGGAGIGGGNMGSKINSIIIEGKTIKRAVGSDGGAGIGGGNQCGVETLRISGGTFEYVKGGKGAAGIGTGQIGTVGKIIITGNTKIQKVYGGDMLSSSAPFGGAAIGGGYERGVNLEITGDVIVEYAKGGPATGAIGGGAKGGGSGANSIKITSGKIYAEAGEGTIYNDIGGSLERVDEIDVNFGTNADIFIGNNKVTKVDAETKANRANYIFQCYDKDDIQMTDVHFIIKSFTDPSYELKPTTDSSGNGYGWLNKINISSEKFAALGYYFEVEDSAGNIYIAKQEGDATQVITVDGITQITIKMKFSEGAEEKNIGIPVPVPGNGIVPYSLSKVGYELDLSAFTGAHSLKSVTSSIDLKYISTDYTQFDLTKDSAIMIYKNGIRDTALETTLKGNDPGGNPYITRDATNQKIMISYPISALDATKYKIEFYLSSKLNDISVKDYKDTMVDLGVEKDIVIVSNGTATYRMNIDGAILERDYTINLTDNENLPYKELIKIN